ncbi:isoquinoline 1-oxidoreductase subunit beta [Streptomyces jeddahensis]|uniref:Isoquinoline 1-oxidoreductase subunit beta n=1 Tax=Streptomyces jeddahensis TaxID=1716141 RepID=A0A177HU65_9ACTN|nr:isoquinoline 1-oxidoreductase subunit beta [Streptomyces jeddahensis]
MAVPPLLSKTIDAEFTFAFASNSPLEPDNAIGDVRSDRAETWASLKSPIVAQQEIAAALGPSQDALTVHVVPGGGSFGRHLFHDVAAEAAEISQKIGKPVKLSWSRTDSFRTRDAPRMRAALSAWYGRRGDSRHDNSVIGAAEVTVDMMRQVLDTNVFGVVRVTDAFLPLLWVPEDPGV